MNILKAIIRIGTVAISLCAAAAFAQNITSLKSGTYVRVDTPCKSPSNSATMNFDGQMFRHGKFCGVPEGSGASVKLTACRFNGVEEPTVPGVISVLNAQSFNLKNQFGTFDFRHCSDAELRGVAQGAQISQPESAEIKKLDPETRMVVLMVLGQSSFKAASYTGWQTISGPFNYIGVTRQDKAITVYVTNKENAWFKVDCSLLDGGGGICYTASTIYTGFFHK